MIAELMLKNIPILKDYKYDPANIIGQSKMTERGLEVTMKDGQELTKDMMFNIFGGAGVTICKMVERDGVTLYKIFVITAFST